MGTRTVRLDQDAEATLARLRRLTGLSISEVLKRGLFAFEEKAMRECAPKKPYDVYRVMELGEGGYSLAPARDAKSALREAILRKRDAGKTEAKK